MDFHSLSRRDLQTLCKRNKIPANMTNVAMADALQALQSVEGISDIQEDIQFQSPKKLDLVSPAVLPRTGRRTEARKVGVAKEEEPKEQKASPLPRARRVTARSSEILNLTVDEAEEEVGKKDVAETPDVPKTRRRPSKKEEAVAEAPTGQKMITTRRRTTKKEENKEFAETPAVRTDRRVTALQAIEPQKEEKLVSVTTGRRARQSSKKEVEEVVMAGADLMSGGLRRSTRVRGRGAAVQMTSLAKEEEEEKQEKKAEDSFGQKNDLCSEEKGVAKTEQEEEEEIKDTAEGNKSSQSTTDFRSNDQGDLVTDCSHEAIQEATISAKESSEFMEEASGNNQIQEGKDEEVDGDDTQSGFQGSPVRGLINSGQDSHQQLNPSAEVAVEEVKNVEKSLEQTENSADKGDFGETLSETKDYGESPVTCDQVDVTSETSGENKEPDDDNRDDLTMHLGSDKIDAEISMKFMESGKDDDVITEKSEKDAGDSDLDGEIAVETMKTDIAIRSPAKSAEAQDSSIKSPRSIGEDLTIDLASDVVIANTTAETTASSDDDGDITEKSQESDGENDHDLTVEIPVEIDESGTDHIFNALAGQISVEAIEDQKTPSSEAEIAGEPLDGVGWLIRNLSVLNPSSTKETKATEMKEEKLPGGGIYREESGLTVMEVGPRGGGEKVKPRAEKQKNYENMSLRKLKAAYKESVITMNNKGEEKRAALKAIDENCI